MSEWIQTTNNCIHSFWLRDKQYYLFVSSAFWNVYLSSVSVVSRINFQISTMIPLGKLLHSNHHYFSADQSFVSINFFIYHTFYWRIITKNWTKTPKLQWSLLTSNQSIEKLDPRRKNMLLTLYAILLFAYGMLRWIYWFLLAW